MDEVEEVLPAGAYLHSSVFAETDRTLATSVQRYWQQRAVLTRRAGHYWLAEDVWDLLRPGQGDPHGSTPLSRFAVALPPSAVVLVVGGSPCQDLTYAGRHRGQLGLCGPVSRHFYAIPVCIWALQHMRPDIRIFGGVENAGSMRPEYRQAILDALGCRCASQAVLMDAKEWSLFPRSRYFFSTLPGDQDTGAASLLGPLPEKRSGIADPGWAFHPDGDKPPLLRARTSPPRTRVSTWQHELRHLEYSITHEHRWTWGSLGSVRERVKTVLPEVLHASLDTLWKKSKYKCDALTWDEEMALIPLMNWIADHGEEHGIRTPPLGERVRSTGRPGYIRALGLDHWTTFQVTGNYFDPDALKRRFLRPLLAALHTGAAAPPVMPPPELYAQFERLGRRAAGAMLPGMAHSPFPDDLEDWLRGGTAPPQVIPSLQAQMRARQVQPSPAGGPATGRGRRRRAVQACLSDSDDFFAAVVAGTRAPGQVAGSSAPTRRLDTERGGDRLTGPHSTGPPCGRLPGESAGARADAERERSPVRRLLTFAGPPDPTGNATAAEAHLCHNPTPDARAAAFGRASPPGFGDSPHAGVPTFFHPPGAGRAEEASSAAHGGRDGQ